LPVFGADVSPERVAPSKRAVFRRRDAVQVKMAGNMGFPARWIMPCVGASIAPVVVEMEANPGGQRSGQLNQGR
jgi:hypothetical protein